MFTTLSKTSNSLSEGRIKLWIEEGINRCDHKNDEMGVPGHKRRTLCLPQRGVHILHCGVIASET